MSTSQYTAMADTPAKESLYSQDLTELEIVCGSQAALTSIVLGIGMAICGGLLCIGDCQR